MKNKYSREIQGKTTGNQIGQMAEVECSKSSKKRMKENIARYKDDIMLIREAMNRDLIDYNKANEAIGRAYMNIQYAKEELKSYKKRGKNNA